MKYKVIPNIEQCYWYCICISKLWKIQIALFYIEACFWHIADSHCSNSEAKYKNNVDILQCFRRFHWLCHVAQCKASFLERCDVLLDNDSIRNFHCFHRLFQHFLWRLSFNRLESVLSIYVYLNGIEVMIFEPAENA